MTEIKRLKIQGFLDFFEPHAVIQPYKVNATANPPAEQWGYSMGAKGEIATQEILKRQAVDYVKENWRSYFRRTIRWHLRRVWDCNGMVEGYYLEMTGVDINTYARHNYGKWCGVKSPTKPNAKLTGLPQMPGVAVFSGDDAESISHVAYLLRKHGPGLLDWYVIQAAGADKGVIITKLSEQTTPFRWWGIMDKYFDYGGEKVEEEEPVKVNRPVIKKGSEGEHVGTLQYLLVGLGYDLKVTREFDDDTADAVRLYQNAHGLKVDAIVGEKTWASLYSGPQTKPKLYKIDLPETYEIEDAKVKQAALEKAGFKPKIVEV